MTTRILFLALALASVVAAQPVVVPTPDRPDESRASAGYTVSNSFEAGYRFAAIDGNEDVYRSTVNYGNGLRLFEGQLRVNSEDGKGALFDELSFNTRGAPTDPYQSNILRIEKNGWYRYDMQLRQADYHNRLPAFLGGEHGLRTERTWQTHELTLRPGSRFEILLGFDRNKRNGPGFSSEGIPSAPPPFDSNNFLRYATDLRQVNNTYRTGVNFRVLGLAVTAIQAFDNYKEDTLYRDGQGFSFFEADNVQQVSGSRRSEPIHGNTPYTVVGIRTEKERRLGFQGNFAYSSGNRNSILSQDATAVDPSRNLSTLRQTFAFGDASRKQGSGDFTVTFMPSLQWTITNTTAANNTRIEGGLNFLELSAFENRFLEFESLGIRYFSNATEASYRPTRSVGVFGAYRTSERRVRTRDALEFPDFGFARPLEEVDNRVHAGAGGVRWTLGKGVRASFDFELGRADQPLTPTSPRKYHNESARVQWRGSQGLSIAGYFKNRINNNPAALTDFSSESLTAGFQATWARPDGKALFDAGYAWIDLDTAAGIFNLLRQTEEEPERGRTFYSSSLHTVNLGARFEAHERVTVYAGYSLAKDTGGSNDSLPSSPGFEAGYPNVGSDGVNLFVGFPLTYQTPRARVSFMLSERWSWNFGWQYYDYGERFTGEQDYEAHVGYVSFRWRF